MSGLILPYHLREAANKKKIEAPAVPLTCPTVQQVREMIEVGKRTQRNKLTFPAYMYPELKSVVAEIGYELRFDVLEKRKSEKVLNDEIDNQDPNAPIHEQVAGRDYGMNKTEVCYFIFDVRNNNT